MIQRIYNILGMYDCVDGKYLYNRCHLIGYQLTGENANKRNLITGTRSLNVDGMLPFENMVADYIKETGNHVLYRVTPVFKGKEKLARGVKMEAQSIEDNEICLDSKEWNEISYKKSCGGMRNPSKVKISVAKKKGYTACKKCVK